MCVEAHSIGVLFGGKMIMLLKITYGPTAKQVIFRLFSLPSYLSQNLTHLSLFVRNSHTYVGNKIIVHLLLVDQIKQRNAMTIIPV